MQAAMLYAMEGQQLQGDAYALDGIPPEYRKLLKRSFFKLVNAKDGMRAPPQEELPDGWSWRALIDALAEKHHLISKHFKTGIGIKLQRIDADIAAKIVAKCQQMDSLVLPVHDSFITYIGHKEQLRKVMATTYQEALHQAIGIDVDPALIELTRGDDETYDPEEVVWAIEGKPEYAGYRRRKKDFLSRMNDDWKWRFTAD